MILNEIRLKANKKKRLEILSNVLNKNSKSEILWYPEEYRQLVVDDLLPIRDGIYEEITTLVYEQLRISDELYRESLMKFMNSHQD